MSLSKLLAFFPLLIFGMGGMVEIIRWLVRRQRPAPKGSPLLGLGLIGLGLLVFLFIWQGFAFERPSEQFMRALHEGDTAAAFTLLDPALQEAVAGPTGLAQWVGARRPQRWLFTSSCSLSQVGRSNGVAWFAAGSHINMSFNLRRAEAGWVIQGIQYGEPGTTRWIGIPSELDCIAD